MKSAQIITRRERDLNTPKQFIRSVGASGVAHAGLALLIVLASHWSYRPTIIVPGYKVNLVTLDTPKPRSLLETPKKKKSPKQKKRTHKKIKKTKQKPLVKSKTVAKKIVPKKKSAPAAVEKIKAPPPKPEKVAREKAPPQKTIVTEGQAFPYLWYLKIIERKVKENWITHGVDVSVQQADPVVRFVIARDGLLASLSIERPSGSDELDRSALEAVRKAQPFPPLPEDYTGGSLAVHFGFTYEQF